MPTAPQIALSVTGRLTLTDSHGNEQKVIIQRVKPGLGNGRMVGNRQIQVRRWNQTVNDRRTWPQIRRRTRFSAAVAEWKAMSDAEREVYRQRGREHSRTGYNLFISERLRLGDTP